MPRRLPENQLPISPELRAAFREATDHRGGVSDAAREIGISKTTVTQIRQGDTAASAATAKIAEWLRTRRTKDTQPRFSLPDGAGMKKSRKQAPIPNESHSSDSTKKYRRIRAIIAEYGEDEADLAVGFVTEIVNKTK